MTINGNDTHMILKRMHSLRFGTTSIFYLNTTYIPSTKFHRHFRSLIFLNDYQFWSCSNAMTKECIATSCYMVSFKRVVTLSKKKNMGNKFHRY